MKVGFIGDIVGRPGREIVNYHLKNIRDEHNLDFVIANGENASHGFGINEKNSNELFSSGIDLLTGGNHSFDRKEGIPFLSKEIRLLRPHNYYSDLPGCGLFKTIINGEKLAVLNLLGMYGMPHTNNPFRMAKELVLELKEEGFGNIILDFHAEATSEKRGMFLMLKGNISAIFGTHTHIGTDDLMIDCGTFYVSDIGLSGCRDNNIGIEAKPTIDRFLTSLNSKFDVPKSCKKIFQIVICEIENGVAIDGYKIRAFDYEIDKFSQRAFIEK